MRAIGAEDGDRERVGLAATATYLPERWMSAAEIAEASGIPEQVILEKFGLRGKHIAAADEHVSDMSVAAARRACSSEHGIDPADDRRRHLLRLDLEGLRRLAGGALDRAPARLRERLRGRVRQRLLRHAGRAAAARKLPASPSPSCGTSSLVAACRESYLLDYANERSRFMFNFGDGAVAGLLVADGDRNELLGSHALTDGSFSLQVKVPAGGSVEPASPESVDGRRHFLDVADPAADEGRARRGQPAELRRAPPRARSSARVRRSTDVSYLCGIHMKRSMHDGDRRARSASTRARAYLDDTGPHERRRPAARRSTAPCAPASSRDGDLVLLLAAGTGYTWAASVVRWGPAMSELEELVRAGARPDRVASRSTQERIDEFARRDRRPAVDPHRPRGAPRRARSGRRSRTAS